MPIYSLFRLFFLSNCIVTISTTLRIFIWHSYITREQMLLFRGPYIFLLLDSSSKFLSSQTRSVQSVHRWQQLCVFLQFLAVYQANYSYAVHQTHSLREAAVRTRTNDRFGFTLRTNPTTGNTG